MNGILGLKRLRPTALKYVGCGVGYSGKAARREWAQTLTFATALTGFTAKRDGLYTHLATVEVDGVDEPVSVMLRLTY